MSNRLPVAFILLLVASQVAAAEDVNSDLFAAINDRLSLMEEVALYKVNNTIPVEDLAREEVVLADTQTNAAREGLNPQSVRQFFAAQIAVAKAIQYRHLADWQSAPALRQADDLQTVIRPALTELGNRIISLLAESVNASGGFDETDRPLFNDAITANHVSLADRDFLFDALLVIRP